MRDLEKDIKDVGRIEDYIHRARQAKTASDRNIFLRNAQQLAKAFILLKEVAIATQLEETES